MTTTRQKLGTVALTTFIFLVLLAAVQHAARGATTEPVTTITLSVINTDTAAVVQPLTPGIALTANQLPAHWTIRATPPAGTTSVSYNRDGGKFVTTDPAPFDYCGRLTPINTANWSAGSHTLTVSGGGATLVVPFTWSPAVAVPTAVLAPTGPVPTPATPAQIAVLEPSVPLGTAVHVDAWQMFPTIAAEQDHVLTWNFGESCVVQDPRNYASGATVDVGLAFPGPSAAHVYATPGVKTITLTDSLRNADGTTGAVQRILTTTATVTPANRTVYIVDSTNPAALVDSTNPAALSITAAQAKLGNNVELDINGGTAAIPLIYNLPAPIAAGFGNVSIVGTGAAKPVLYLPGGGGMVTTSTASRDITFRNVAFDSDGARDLGNIYGTGVSFINCTFLHLDTGPRQTGGCHGFLMQGCTQPLLQSCKGQFTYDGGDHSVYIGNIFSDSLNESTNRFDNNGVQAGATNFAYVYNRTGRSNGGKSALEIRDAANGFIAYNLIVGAAASFDCGENGDTISNLDVLGNVSVDTNNADTASYMTVKQGINGANFQGNKVWACSESYTVTPGNPPSKNIRWFNNWGCGWKPNARYAQMNGTPVGWLQDATFGQGVFTHGAGPAVAPPATMPSN